MAALFLLLRISEPTGPQRSSPVAVKVMPPAGGQVVSLLLIFKGTLGRKQGIIGHTEDKSEGIYKGRVVSVEVLGH